MAWAAFVAGTALSAASAVYQGNAIAAGNELRKRQVKHSAKLGQIEALGEQNDKLEMLEYLNADTINKSTGMIGASPTFGAILNANNEKARRDIRLLELKGTAAEAKAAMEIQALDMASKTSRRAGVVNAAGTVLQSWGMHSMLGNLKDVPDLGGAAADNVVATHTYNIPGGRTNVVTVGRIS